MQSRGIKPIYQEDVMTLDSIFSEGLGHTMKKNGAYLKFKDVPWQQCGWCGEQKL